ncbi:MAG: ArsR family transcriptional regulator [Gemmatimonadota bacterium]
MPATAVAEFGALVGDEARARMLVALFDQVELRATDLARHGAVSAQTASFHLRKLCEAGILTVAKRGRSRVYALSGPSVAGALEAVMAMKPRTAPPPAVKSIELARTCYDHLAGRLGVAIADALIRAQWLRVDGGEYAVEPAGEQGLAALGVDVASLRRVRRQFAKRCLDWTERRYHVAGSLGAALCDSLLRRKWVLRVRGTRALHITPDGYRGLRRTFGLERL